MRTTRQRAKSRDKENKKRHDRREAKKLERVKSDGFRSLTLPSGVWKWDAGKSNLVIRSPRGEKIIVGYCKLFSISQDTLENLQENKGMWVMPSDVRAYIENNLVNP